MKTKTSNATLSTELQIAIEQAKSLPTLDQFQTWASNALRHEDGSYEVCFRVVSPEESRELNHHYRKKDKPTNVLSFYYDDDEHHEGDIQYLGDIVICADIVMEEAKAQHKELLAHWAHLITHGMLHLQGYDHQKDDEAEAMESLETTLLQNLGFDNPYSA